MQVRFLRELKIIPIRLDKKVGRHGTLENVLINCFPPCSPYHPESNCHTNQLVIKHCCNHLEEPIFGVVTITLDHLFYHLLFSQSPNTPSHRTVHKCMSP